MPILTAETISETFPCPSCGEFIAADSSQCRYCAVNIPYDYARLAAEAQNKINKACDEAIWLRTLAGAMWVFFFVRFIPFFGIFGLGGMAMSFVATPFWLAYWMVRFGTIKTRDVDYVRAKRNWLIALVLWLLMVAIFLIRFVLILLATRS